MKRLIPLLLTVICAIATIAAPTRDDSKFSISGRIKDAMFKQDLTQAVVCLQDSLGQTIDSCVANRGIRVINGDRKELAYFNIPIPRIDSTYVFVVKCKGYTPYHFTFTFDSGKYGRREEGTTLPMIFLERAPVRLSEVSVTTSKIKFYNKGDTVVFNADAFQLAEGSMLDALISQLPGVKLEEGGQITVNGEFVESLLLNGKQFLDGNNRLMLENIGAYTVKNIEVYKGQTEREKWENDSTAVRHLTMDVKLKREYNMGWLINAQGGYGTDDRYSGRLFANWFTPTTRITLLGNANNLNDTRKPGKADSWRPEMMPSGTRTYHMGALNYQTGNAEETRSFNGHLTFERTATDNRRTTARTNFLAGGDTYENSFSRSRIRDIKLDTRHYANILNDTYWFGAMATGRYIRKDNSSADLSGSFNTEQTSMTMKALEAIYSDGTPEQLAAIINRSATLSDGTRHEGEVQFFPGITIKLPRSSDRIHIETGIKYNTNKEELWRDYTINYGADPVPAHRRRRYTDNSPNRTFTQISSISYDTRLNRLGAWLTISYEYRFMMRDRDSYMYALERLEDLGIFGSLPSGWLDTFDPANSYTSRLIENSHTIRPSLTKYLDIDSTRQFQVRLSPEFTYRHSRLNYWRDGRSYLLSEDFFTAKVARYCAEFSYLWGGYGPAGRKTFANILELSYTATPKTPNPLDMVAVTNDSDPLNISVGNPDLHTEYEHRAELLWIWNPKRTAHPIYNSVRLTASITDNSLVRGYTYDTSTGVRVNKTYNVNGNSSLALRNHFNLQFGAAEQFSISTNTTLSTNRYADMIGENTETPARSKVRTATATQDIRLAWQLGKQNLSLSGTFTNRHTTSDRRGFNTIDARHYSAGFTCTFVIPGGFGLTSDFMVYARRGYGLSQLDTTDPIWNLRLTYTPPRHSRLTLMLDGFDMLHRLSNVNYAVSASGRTVSYTNTLPRYIMLSLQYRLNIQPPKRR